MSYFAIILREVQEDWPQMLAFVGAFVFFLLLL